MINEGYFDTLDSKNTYVLGIIAANSSIVDDSVNILHPDKDILSYIAADIGTLSSIEDIGNLMYSITINSKAIVDRLLVLGLDHTGKVRVRDEQLRHFLRGYVEGKGGGTLTLTGMNIILEDTYDRLNWIQAKVHTITGLPKRKVMSKIQGKIKKMVYKGKPALLLLTWLYTNCNLYSKLIKEPYNDYLIKFPDRINLSYNMPCPGSKYILSGEDIVR
jgi:hypothetical protein